MTKVLLGNTFPLTLVRRRVQIDPVSIEDAKALLEAGYVSFWGHSNTAVAAKAQLGFDVLPETERPALKLTSEGLPELNGVVAAKVVILSPEYRAGYRPAIGVETGVEDILGWQALVLTFPQGA